MLSPVQILALSNVDVGNAARAEVTPGTHTVEPFTVCISGQIKVGESETYAPTADIPLIPTLALAIKRMGIQREPFMKVLQEAMTQVLTLDKTAREALATELGLADFERDLRTKVLSRLPRKSRKGKVAASLNVQEVTSVIAA